MTDRERDTEMRVDFSARLDALEARLTALDAKLDRIENALISLPRRAAAESLEATISVLVARGVGI